MHILFAEARGGIAKVEQQVAIGQGRPDSIHHAPVQKRTGSVNAGRIEENHLGAFHVEDAFDGGSGGLRFLGNNRQLAAHQRVQQSGFAGVGPS